MREPGQKVHLKHLLLFGSDLCNGIHISWFPIVSEVSLKQEWADLAAGWACLECLGLREKAASPTNNVVEYTVPAMGLAETAVKEKCPCVLGNNPFGELWS